MNRIESAAALTAFDAESWSEMMMTRTPGNSARSLSGGRPLRQTAAGQFVEARDAGGTLRDASRKRFDSGFHDCGSW